ncbi:MAG: hypothetical protein EXR27_13600 [Betaproteobacteria bacterium]|nr:hypothetical protein [Betaproteobacteria bacterium]
MKRVKSVLTLAALVLLGGCVAVPVASGPGPGYYNPPPAPGAYYPPPPVYYSPAPYYGPSIGLGIGIGTGRRWGGRHWR